jgi:hypothetical protein
MRLILLVAAVSGLVGYAGALESGATTAGVSGGFRPSFRECIAAWNAPDDGTQRALVARVFVPVGYTHAGIQMSLTTGVLWRPDPNPVGCRVVFFRHDRWVAYLARRTGAQFRFRASLPYGRLSDQRSLWSKTSQRGPNNTRIIQAAKLALRG